MREHQWRRAALALALIGGLALAASASESDRPADVRRVQAATAIFRQALQGPGHTLPETVLKTGECVAIVPGYKTLALGLGGGYGKGIAMCRNSGNTAVAGAAMPGWSAPVFITIGGASIGTQIGVQSADLILIYQSRAGLEAMLNQKVRIGVAAGATAGPIGRAVEASTNASLNAEVVGYAHSHGLYIGVNINGAIVQPDETGNRSMYPHEYWQDVLDGKLPAPADTQPLISELNASPYTNPAVLQANPGAAAQPAGPSLPGPGFGAPEPFELGVAYNRVNSSIALDGWDVVAGWRPPLKSLPDLNLIADIGHNTGSQTLVTTTVNTGEWNYLFGPEFDMPHRIFDPYAHVLFGLSHLGQDTFVTAGPTTSVGFNSFAWEFGAGLKINVMRKFSIRLVQLDFLHTTFNGNSTYDGRLSIGAEVHF